MRSSMTRAVSRAAAAATGGTGVGCCAAGAAAGRVDLARVLGGYHDFHRLRHRHRLSVSGHLPVEIALDARSGEALALRDALRAVRELRRIDPELLPHREDELAEILIQSLLLF